MKKYLEWFGVIVMAFLAVSVIIMIARLSLTEHDAATESSFFFTENMNTGIAHLQDSVIFVVSGEQVGKFWYDDETRQFEFEGDAEISWFVLGKAMKNSEMTGIQFINNLATASGLR